MKNRVDSFRAFMLIAAAGLVAPGFAQPSTTVTPPDREPQKQRAADRDLATNRRMIAESDYRAWSWLKGRDVANLQKDNIATLSDLIINRGTGRIDYAVLKTGTILGMGGKEVAIPFNDLAWDATAGRLVLNSTPEQLKTYPEFSDKEWIGIMEARPVATNTQPRDATRAGGEPGMSTQPGNLRDRLSKDSSDWSRDPYATTFDPARHVQVQGEITSVERVQVPDHGEQVVVSVMTDSKETKKVALGPSWFINGALMSPERGDKVMIDAVTIPNDPSMSVASTVKLDNGEFRLRNNTGAAAWTGESFDSGGKSYSAAYYRHVLLSKVRGAKIDCRGTECGKVDDVIVDTRAGEATFLSIDPNQNFLGIADTKRLVPWSTVTVALTNDVRLDASKEMVLASPKTPSDLASLGTSGTAEQVYGAYQVGRPSWRTNRTHETRQGNVPEQTDRP